MLIKLKERKEDGVSVCSVFIVIKQEKDKQFVLRRMEELRAKVCAEYLKYYLAPCIGSVEEINHEEEIFGLSLWQNGDWTLGTIVQMVALRMGIGVSILVGS